METIGRIRREHWVKGKSIKEIAATSRTIKAVQLIDPGPVQTVHHFPGLAHSLGALMESINLILAIKATADAM